MPFTTNALLEDSGVFTSQNQTIEWSRCEKRFDKTFAEKGVDQEEQGDNVSNSIRLDVI